MDLWVPLAVRCAVSARIHLALIHYEPHRQVAAGKHYLIYNDSRHCLEHPTSVEATSTALTPERFNRLTPNHTRTPVVAKRDGKRGHRSVTVLCCTALATVCAVLVCAEQLIGGRVPRRARLHASDQRPRLAVDFFLKFRHVRHLVDIAIMD